MYTTVNSGPSCQSDDDRTDRHDEDECYDEATSGAGVATALEQMADAETQLLV